MTKTKLAEHGVRPRPEASPFATIEYGRGRRFRRYELWAVADCEPKRDIPAESGEPLGSTAGARVAEAAFWRRPTVEARRAERQEERAAAAQRRLHDERGWVR